jgi:hypothetical protein
MNEYFFHRWKFIGGIFSIIIFTIFFLLFNGCNDPVNIQKPIEAIKFDIGLNDSLKLSEFVDDVKYVNLKTNFSITIEKIKIFDNKIFLLDALASRSLFIFNKNGEVLQKIKGYKDKYFRSPTDFIINRDSTISIIDINHRRIVVFDKQYNFKDKFIFNNMTFFFESYFQKIYYFDFTYMCNRRGSDPNLIITNSDFEIIDTRFPTNDLECMSIFEYSTFSRINNTLYYTPLFNDTVYILDSLSITPHKLIDFGHNKFNPKSVYPEQTPNFKYNTVMNSEYAYNFTNYFENSNFVVFNYSYRKSDYFAVYNKFNNYSKAVKRVNNDIDNTPLSSVFWAQDSMLVFFVENEIDEEANKLFNDSIRVTMKYNGQKNITLALAKLKK